MEEEKNIQINKELFTNICMAISVMIYYIFINLGYANIELDIFKIDLKVFSMIILGITIILFENAYKKESSKLAIIGIECLILASHTLSAIHVTTIFNFYFKYYILTSSYCFAIYYVLKDIIIYTKERRNYLNSLSDISEIIKKEEPRKKEASKKKRGK